MPSNRSFKESSAIGSQKPCSLAGCTKNRDGVSPFCSTHGYRHRSYGHPLGALLPRDVYAKELEEVTQLFITFKDHPGLLAVCKWLDDWICHGSA
jgi:hypothetical protein